jgi:hypothetical protein
MTLHMYSKIVTILIRTFPLEGRIAVYVDTVIAQGYCTLSYEYLRVWIIRTIKLTCQLTPMHDFPGMASYF